MFFERVSLTYHFFILVGARIVVSGDGRYYSKEAIQVILHSMMFLNLILFCDGIYVLYFGKQGNRKCCLDLDTLRLAAIDKGWACQGHPLEPAGILFGVHYCWLPLFFFPFLVAESRVYCFF